MIDIKFDGARYVKIRTSLNVKEKTISPADLEYCRLRTVSFFPKAKIKGCKDFIIIDSMAIIRI